MKIFKNKPKFRQFQQVFHFWIWTLLRLLEERECQCIQGHLKVAQYLCDNGADINAKKDDGMTPLLYAADNGNIEIVKMLIEKGIDINKQTDFGQNALNFASLGAYNEIIDLLIENGLRYNIWL